MIFSSQQTEMESDIARTMRLSKESKLAALVIVYVAGVSTVNLIAYSIGVYSELGLISNMFLYVGTFLVCVYFTRRNFEVNDEE